MTQTCTSCAQPLPADAQFCDECGTKVPALAHAGLTNFTRVRELFDKAMSMDASKRESWLWDACQGDQAMFGELTAMLRSSPQDSFLAAPAIAPPSLAPPSTSPPAAPSTGPYIGAYKLLRELGRGGMGVVYLAVRDDGAFRKNVAIKLLLRENVTPEFVTRFKQERQVLAALDHPNIARILDGGDSPDGSPFYVMEYVEGKSIHEYCDDQRLSLTARIKLFQQVCQSVQYLHQNSILHRDLKPSNILVSSDGIVKLLDFGIAKLVGAGSFANADLTGVQGSMMTPNYASPEQINGGTLHAASDIYSMGVILYALLTGRAPFGGLEEKMAKMATRQDPHPPSASIREDLKATESTAQLRKAMLGELDSIVLKTLKYDPRDRYASAFDLSTDLQRFLDGQPVAAHRETVGRRSARFFRRTRAAIAAAVVFLLLAGFGGWQWHRVQLQKAEAAAREAEVTAHEAQLQALLDDLEKRLDETKTGEERIQDVSKLKKAFATDYKAIAARKIENDALMKRAVRYLDRVPLADSQLGVEVADAYQQLGVLQENREAAVATYQKAALTLAKYPEDDKARERLVTVRESVEKLGGKLEESALAVTTPVIPVAPEPEPEPAPVAKTVTKQVAIRAPVIQQERPVMRTEPAPVAAVARPVVQTPAVVSPELQDEYVGAESRVQIAEQTIAPVRANLERQGQTLNADTLTAMARMKAMLDKGRREMASGNGAAAKESFGAARALADRVLRSVGR